MKIAAVLDTNVIMENPYILNTLSKQIVILTTTVLSELDKHKSGLEEVNRNVREFVRQLNDHKVEYFNSEEVPGNSNDMKIIQSCVMLSKKYKVTLYTNDLLMAALAKTKKVKTERTDKQAKSEDMFYTGVAPTGTIDTKILTKDLNQYTIDSQGVLHKKTSHGLMRLPKDFSIMDIKHKNLEQRFALDALMDESIKLVTLSGAAGSGKTIVSIAAGLELLLNGEHHKAKYNQFMVARPVIPMGKDIGYLPGTLEEKMAPWMMPIVDNMQAVLGGGHKSGAFQELQDQGLVKIEPLTYIRGRSISNTFILIDEAQNLSAHEIETIITRAGENTKIVLTGDINQIDNPKLDSVNNGLSTTIRLFRDEKIAAHVHFTKCERSELAEAATRVFKRDK